MSVIGTLGVEDASSLPSALASVDGGSPSHFNVSATTDILYGHTFFKASNLSIGTHEVKITMQPSDARIYLDYFLVESHERSSSSPMSNLLDPYVFWTIYHAEH